MNVFLPFKDYTQCAKSLDTKRLFKQVVEAMQIITILTTGKTKSGKDYPLSMKHHPVVLMWADNIESLKNYYNACLQECLNRGIKTTMPFYECEQVDIPKFVDDKLNLIYQSNLKRKDPVYYTFEVEDNLLYPWK